MTPALFRQVFRQFADPGDYPESAITFYLTLAGNFLNGSNSSVGQRFDPMSLDHAVSLFAAHHLVLDTRDVQTVAAGGVAGELKGPASAKAIDKVSQSYDTKAVTFEDEAFWNQTRFGVQLMNLVHMFGAGGVQLGTPADYPTSWPYWTS